MNKLAFVLIMIAILISSIRCQTTKCDNPQYIIPFQPIDKTFDAGINAIRGSSQLTTLIQNPTPETAKDYLISLAPFSAPLFALAGLTLILFIATIIQVICFNSCSKECCGNQLGPSTYNICCIKTMTFSFLILCFLTVCISIPALILNSDLQHAIDFTQCNTQNIIYEGYNGNNNPNQMWSGVSNFQISINQFSAAIQNNVPFLVSYFSAANPIYTVVTSTTAGSSYANSQVFSCQNSATTINCPFPATSQPCPSTYQAQFNAQFCNASFKGSASNQIADEMAKNSTTWQSNTVKIALALTNLNTQPAQANALVTSVSNFTASVSQYESLINKGFDQLDIVQGGISIGFYVYYSFTLGISLIGLVSVCMLYYCKVFSCRYALYVFWYLYFIFTILLFVNSGLFLGGSIAFQDSCQAYPYYFQNSSNFNKLKFGDPQIGGIFNTCFYGGGPKSIFSGFQDTSILTQFGNLYTQYTAALPPQTFFTVVTAIQNQLYEYASNPNTVTIQTVSVTSQPQVALDQMNTFANFSAIGSTQSCKLTLDYFTYDVVNCNLYLTNQAVGTNSCVVMTSTNINTIQSGRIAAFTTRGCNVDGTNYQNRMDALLAYLQSIKSIVMELAPLTASTPPTPLQAYQNNYFGYYSNVMNFYNQDVQQIFNGFFNPYNSLQAGSSCGFVNSSMNGIVDIACNQLQAYINSYSVLNIIESTFLFFLFILSYFMTTRFEYYEYLQGNFNNAGKPTFKTDELPTDFTSRNIELLNINNTSL